MKKLFLFMGFLLLTTNFLLASQMFVVGEVFTQTWCPYCPAARSALHQMYNQPETFPYFIPLIWQGDGPHPSPNYSGRGNLYGVSGIPHGQWGGTIAVVGGGTGTYGAYVNAHNQIVNTNSPIDLNLEISLNNQNQLVLNVDAVMTGNISTTNNNIIFILTYDLTSVMDPDYFASVKRYYQTSFPLTSTGQTGNYSHAFDIDPTWDLFKVTGVVIVQNLVNGNAVIHQAAKADFSQLTSMFSSNVQQGPPELHVQFYDFSFPAQDIESWAWDLNGDGTIDSTEQNPFFVYTEVGTYDVTLQIFDGTDTVELTMENYITVTSPDNVSGNVSGIWNPDHGVYYINDDITISDESYLILQPGVEVRSSNSAIIIEGSGYIYANAEDDDPITLTSDTNWKGIRIDSTIAENTFNNCMISKANQTAMIINNARVNIIGNTFYENSGAADPGAVKITNSENIVMRNNTFANNHSTNGIGAVDIYTSNFEVKNNLFVNNTGFFGSSFGIRSGSAIIFNNNTIANNEYLSSNGFHVFNHNSFLQIRNSIVRGEGSIISAFTGSSTLVEYSNITGGYSGVDNIDTDPLFENSTEGSGIEYNGLEAIWYLSDESPCIDAGNPAATYNDPEDPYNPGYAQYPAKGTIRNDMGAYGGSGTSYWVSVDDNLIVQPSVMNRIIAYPNPFNPTVNISLSQIEFSLDRPINLRIYNIRGQLVKTMLENELTNRTEFVWNGLDEENRAVPSGIYFIRFASDNLQVNHKVLLLK
ncbi:MAG: T9SS type A sorting domain-containing protein [Candidatus Cloacimonetes bacterium]|nr:T9SS type A sorting domain-containing protein [Candidatus Cloacimonadota bacterium]